MLIRAPWGSWRFDAPPGERTAGPSGDGPESEGGATSAVSAEQLAEVSEQIVGIGSPDRRIGVLVVDSDPRTAEACQRALAGRGYAIERVATLAEAGEALSGGAHHVVVVEMTPPDRSGFDFLRELRLEAPSTIAIATSSDSTIRSAVEAVKLGAYDYLVKPFSDEALVEAIADALEKRAFFGGARTGPMDEFHGMVGRSRAMLELRQWVSKTAASHASVLLYGELGTGKELVAHVLHERSQRAAGPFVVARCTGAADELRSEWFGRMGGGAVTPGAFELASGGTLVLKNVDELSPALQDDLSQAISSRRFVPVGGTDPHKLNVRLISASHRNLAGLVAEGRFREDLSYRLGGHTVRCPSLRERREDIPLLVDYFLTRFCREARHRPIQVTPAAYARLAEHVWPGNVRELEGVIEAAALRSQEDQLDVEDLRFVDADPVSSPVPASAAELKERLKALRAGAVVELERLFVVRALERNQGNVSRAARQVGMQRPNFQALMRRHRVLSGDYAAAASANADEGSDEGEVTRDGTQASDDDEPAEPAGRGRARRGTTAPGQRRED